MHLGCACVEDDEPAAGPRREPDGAGRGGGQGDRRHRRRQVAPVEDLDRGRLVERHVDPVPVRRDGDVLRNRRQGVRREQRLVLGVVREERRVRSADGDVEALPRRIDREPLDRGDVLCAVPGDRGPHGLVHRRRVEDRRELVGVQDPVRLTGSVVAAAVVEERRHLLAQALPVLEAELDVVCARERIVPVRLLPRVEDQLPKRHHLGHGHKQLVAAAVDGRARLYDDELVAAGRIRMLLDLEAARDPDPVQILVVPPQLAEEVQLLVREVALEQQLAREVVVAGELRCVALGTVMAADDG